MVTKQVCCIIFNILANWNRFINISIKKTTSPIMKLAMWSCNISITLINDIILKADVWVEYLSIQDLEIGQHKNIVLFLKSGAFCTALVPCKDFISWISCSLWTQLYQQRICYFRQLDSNLHIFCNIIDPFIDYFGVVLFSKQWGNSLLNKNFSR